MPKNVLAGVFCFMWIIRGYATDNPEVDFGKVSEEELKMTHYDLDSSANAIVLADFGKTDFTYNQSSGIQMVFTRHRRIKILNPDGYQWADVAVPLYKDGTAKEIITQVKGFTHNLEGGKVVKTKLKNEGKFLEEYDKNRDLYKFTLPNVKAGSVIEYTYKITSDFLFNLQDWEFQSAIPTVWSEYEVEVPEYFTYKPLFQGYYSLAVNEQAYTNGTFNITIRTQTGDGSLRSPIIKRETRQEQVNFRATRYRWAAKNVPALVKEPYVTTMDDYVMKVELELGSTQFPGETHKNYTTTWEKIDKELLESTYFGDILARTGSIKNQVSSLIAGAESDTEKAERIYQYVQKHTRWNENSRLYAEQLPKQTLESQVGNSADINLLLIAMLREAGIQAEPVVLSTRDHGMLRQQFPRLTQYNYVIAQASVEDKTILLDATSSSCSMGILPVRCLNHMGRLVSNGLGEKWISLLPESTSAQNTMATLSIADGQLQGTIAASSSGYNAMLLRHNISTANGIDGYAKQLKETLHDWSINDYQVASYELLGQPIKETYQVVLNEATQEAGNLIYLNPILIGSLNKNPFSSEFRAYPVDYPYPEKELFMLILSLPEGYAVDELPEELVIALPENAAIYSYTVKQSGNTIQLVSQLEIKKMKFYAQEYPHLREFFNQIVSKQQEQIVLRKQ